MGLLVGPLRRTTSPVVWCRNLGKLLLGCSHPASSPRLTQSPSFSPKTRARRRYGGARARFRPTRCGNIGPDDLDHHRLRRARPKGLRCTVCFYRRRLFGTCRCTTRGDEQLRSRWQCSRSASSAPRSAAGPTARSAGRSARRSADRTTGYRRATGSESRAGTSRAAHRGIATGNGARSQRHSWPDRHTRERRSGSLRRRSHDHRRARYHPQPAH